MELVFCGTPQFAVPTLKTLVTGGHNVRLVVTQPDRPSGRGQEPVLPAVKQLAQSLRLPVAQPEKIKSNQEFRAQLEAAKPRAIVVVGYGRIIPEWMISLPPLGNINLHASLLPKYRGAAPVQWAIARGETVTGVTTMLIGEGLDSGHILLQKKIPIAPHDTAVTLAPKLAEMGAQLMVETLRGLEAGTIQPKPQEHSRATFAPILKKQDGLVDFNLTAVEIVNRMRGFQPWPGTFTMFRGKNLVLHSARPATSPSLLPGELATSGETLLVGCGAGTALEILELQAEGKRRIRARDFIHGYHPKTGEKLAM